MTDGIGSRIDGTLGIAGNDGVGFDRLGAGVLALGLGAGVLALGLGAGGLCGGLL
jgi:hypothetical protein